MVVFFEYGRLGNQLFQYASIRKLFPNEKIILFGFRDLEEAVDNVDAVFIATQGSFCRRSFILLLQKLLHLCSILRFFGSVKESRYNGKYLIDSKVGLFPWFTLLLPSCFQHEQFTSALDPAFRLKTQHLVQASQWLETSLDEYTREKTVFVQIRRGDYLVWPDPNSPAVVGILWYRKIMGQFRKELVNPIFVIITDDPWYAEDMFADDQDTVISKNCLYTDLAIMSLCDYGILSPSSFAWWGAFFSRLSKKNESINEYYAPKYWAGHRSNKWIPEGFNSDWITYIK